MKEQKSMIHILTERSFQKNKGRNLAAVLAIVLTTMMFTALFTLAQSLDRNMTKRQVRAMLTFEGLYYAGMTLAASYVLSALAVGVLVRAMADGGYTTFHFTLFPLAVCTPVLIAFAVLIPYVCFKNLEKRSVVERLRAVG